ncbi:MAG: PadR family transcriptional regulator [Chloroflexi bacterium]|nr:MAG: PadR family transcriptional regulator [Chloroflexota bacterium]MBA4375876.1 PadR family transcriptional regulator [Anaerolinea sp.]
MSVRHALLGLLAQQPRYGYELCAGFTALAGGRENWDVKPAQIYTTLSRMTDSGLVTLANGKNDNSLEKPLYSITLVGMEELMNWFRDSVLEEPHQDAFYLKLMLSLELDEVDAVRLIQIQRTALFQELHRITELRQSLDPQQQLAQILLMDKAVMHLEADVRWLDMIESRLEEVQHQPPPKPYLRPRGRPPSQ